MNTINNKIIDSIIRMIITALFICCAVEAQSRVVNRCVLIWAPAISCGAVSNAGSGGYNYDVSRRLEMFM
jgi:hypothetical protein